MRVSFNELGDHRLVSVRFDGEGSVLRDEWIAESETEMLVIEGAFYEAGIVFDASRRIDGLLYGNGGRRKVGFGVGRLRNGEDVA